MKTIKTKKIGSRIILDKFDELPICPESTRLATKSAVKNLPESLAAAEKDRSKNAHNARTRAALQKGRKEKYYIENAQPFLDEAKTKEEKDGILIEIEKARKVFTEESENYLSFKVLSEAAEIELSELNTVADVAKREYIKANPVFTGARKNEVICTESQISELKTAFDNLGENEQVELILNSLEVVSLEASENQVELKETVYSVDSYNAIEDFRGKQYFFDDGEKWIDSEIITDLGVTRNTVVVDGFEDQAIERADLNQSQSEEIRFQGLIPEQKEIEKEQEIKNSMSLSVNMKAELEILADNDALSKSQDFYQSELERIELKYA